ncbi:MAG: MinD/ParA family protein [Desulfobacterales bacterium]|nr:MinD/ParA family protein [Desulfobacterales bacterium]
MEKASPRVISITSGKGGVGKTNITANLAIAFARIGKKVLILDGDLGLANIDIILGINSKYNISHVVNGEKELSEIIAEGPEGIKLIPAGSGFMNLTNLTEGQKLNLLTEFESLDDNFDIFLIDTGAGISPNVIYFNIAAEECLIIVTPEPTSITDAYALMKVMHNHHGAKYFKLLLNMVKNESEAKFVYVNLSQVVDRFLKGVLIEYVGFIPTDKMIQKSVIKRKTVIELFPDAPSSQKFHLIAQELLKFPVRNDYDGNIKFFLNKFLNYSKS